MIDTQLLGETAARCMEYLDEHEALDGGEIQAVLIVVVAQDSEESSSFTRTFSSDTSYYRQIGLATAGLECVRDGFRHSNEPPGDDGDDE